MMRCATSKPGGPFTYIQLLYSLPLPRYARYAFGISPLLAALFPTLYLRSELLLRGWGRKVESHVFLASFSLSAGSQESLQSICIVWDASSKSKIRWIFHVDGQFAMLAFFSLFAFNNHVGSHRTFTSPFESLLRMRLIGQLWLSQLELLFCPHSLWHWFESWIEEKGSWGAVTSTAICSIQFYIGVLNDFAVSARYDWIFHRRGRCGRRVSKV